MNIVERFLLSRQTGWELTKEEFNEAYKALNPNTILVVNHNTQFYLLNKDYIRAKVVKRANGNENRDLESEADEGG